jgi:glycosyltransferase involved in cell wall biosynthesis
MPRVSVIMTAYNAAPFLREAIDSVIAQTFQDWELLILEHGSTDDTASIIRSYSDPRIVPHFLPQNIGRSNALNYLCERTRGEYVAVLDADDVSEPNRLAVEVAFLDEHREIAIVGSCTKLIDEHGAVTGYYMHDAWPKLVNESLSWTMPVIHSTMVVRRSATSRRANFVRGRLETLKILERARSLAKSPAAAALNRRARAATMLALGYYALLEGDVGGAWSYVRRGLRTDVSSVFRNQKLRSLLQQPIPGHHRSLNS